MKTPYKLSQELNVTPQAIYKKIKQFNNQIQNNIQKENGKILLNDEAERVLRESFLEVEQPVVEPVVEPLNNPKEQFNNQFNSEVEYLREQNRILLDELNKEREASRQQTQNLFELSEKLAELTKNEQILMLQSKNTPLLPADEQHANKSNAPTNSNNGETEHEVERKSFWQKLWKFGRNNKSGIY